MSRFDGSRGPPQIAGMTSLKVDNLTYRTNIEDLEHYFGKYGDVGDIYIPRDRHRRESRGFAFVRYYEKRDAEDAIDSLDGQVIDGREIRVTLAKYDRPTENLAPRGGGGRRPYGGGGGGGGRYGRSPPRRGHRDGGRYERRDRYSRRSYSRSRSRSHGRRSRSRSPKYSPRRRSPSPRRSISPRRRSMSPRRRSDSPRRHRDRSGSRSPYSRSPKGRSPSESPRK